MTRLQFRAARQVQRRAHCARTLYRWLSKIPLCCAVLLFLANVALAESAKGAVDARAGFAVEVNNRQLHHQVEFEPVMPGSEVVFSTTRSLASRVSVRVNGVPVKRSHRFFTWRAPGTAGNAVAEVSLTSENGKGVSETLRVQLFVMVPASAIRDGKLNGYRIGKYPPPLRDLAAYRAPKGFIEVTEANIDTHISPNFTLGQFLCKQASGYPKYLVLQPPLLTKLEELLFDVNRAGIATDSFVVMSGYRTPFYNAAIKNVPSSYHIYGGAADVYIDVGPKDGRMDDINADGKRDRADAAFLYKMADTWVTRNNRPELTGGVGEYGSNSAHGPFVHIDVRGFRARWGHSD